MTDLKKVLMERDGMTSEEADTAISEARDRVFDGEDPDDVLQDEFGLEPDYVFDLIDIV
jgi:hypothetical protein